MANRRLIVLAVCLAICLGIGSMAMAATIQSGNVTYWDGHYLAGQPVHTGRDIFGWNFQARVFNGPTDNAFGPWRGEAPVVGDRAADLWMLFQWNEAYLSREDGDDPGTHLDSHPFVDWGGAHHDTFDGDWQGSGAVCAWDLSMPDGGWHHFTVAAAPAGATFTDVEHYPGCICRSWYAPDGTYLGDSPSLAPAEDRLTWILVKLLVYCDGALVCNYHNPEYSPVLGNG